MWVFEVKLMKNLRIAILIKQAYNPPHFAFFLPRVTQIWNQSKSFDFVCLTTSDFLL